jgi:hypothetical protein
MGRPTLLHHSQKLRSDLKAGAWVPDADADQTSKKSTQNKTNETPCNKKCRYKSKEHQNKIAPQMLFVSAFP